MNNLGTDLWLPIGVECCNYVPTYNECVDIGELFFFILVWFCTCVSVYIFTKVQD